MIEKFLPACKLLTKDQELLALIEGYQIPLLMEPVQEKVLKDPKLNQEQQKQVGLEVKAMFRKGLHFKSLSLKRGIFDQFVLEQQKRLREPTSHKLEGSELVHSLQTLEDERFALSEACVANRGLHVQNRPEGWIFQCSFTQRYTKIRTVFLDIELQNVENMSHTYQIDNIATLSYLPKMGGIKNPELM